MTKGTGTHQGPPPLPVINAPTLEDARSSWKPNLEQRRAIKAYSLYYRKHGLTPDVPLRVEGHNRELIGWIITQPLGPS